jgi:glycosyltransferase involved in cell wall biosynthesis
MSTFAVPAVFSLHTMGNETFVLEWEEVDMKQRGKRKLKKTKVPIRRVPKPVTNSAHPKVSVVIPVMNEHRTIRAVIRQARLVHPDTEIIVVVNGSKDGSRRIARRMGAKVIHYHQSLGHDVGRSIGAMHARGNIILFMDGDFVITAKDLKPFIIAVEKGIDVALNGYSGVTGIHKAHSVVLAKHALNASLARPDLQGASMTTIPHAISRRALQVIEARNLSVPPLAHAIAIEKGLNVHKAHIVQVGRKNPRKRKNFKVDPLKNLIIGDHLEAINWLFAATNERGNMTDLTRDRSLVG